MHRSIPQRMKAGALRRSMTGAERALWAGLRNRRLAGAKVRRQVPIGPYIVDFACLEHRLVIEIDAAQRAAQGADRTRDHWLETEGYTVLRYGNTAVLGNRAGVLAEIARHLPPHPDPLPQGEREQSAPGRKPAKDGS